MVVVIDPDPVAGAAYIPTTNICPGVTVQFDGSMSLAATGYSWTFPQGNPSSASSGIATPAISFGLSGTHNFTFTATNLCGTDTYNGQITVDVCTAINTVSNANLINIYPNPATNILNITGLLNVENIRLLDVTGKVITRINEVPSNSLTIDLTHVSQGLYFLQVKTNGKVQSFKIIKQ